MFAYNENVFIPFKERKSFKERYNETSRIKDKYSDRVPVVVEPIKSLEPSFRLDKEKFLVPNHLTIQDFILVIRKRLNVNQTQGLYFFIKNVLVVPTQSIGSLYKEHIDEDGYLYISYGIETTFG